MTAPMKSADMREKILKLEAAMQAMPEHQIEINSTNNGEVK